MQKPPIVATTDPQGLRRTRHRNAPSSLSNNRFPSASVGPIFVVGPTGVGKSSLACALARAMDAEIVGADAFQVYDGIPTLTAQPDGASRGGIPHHLIGCIPVERTYDAAAYHDDARAAIRAIQGRGRVPIVVGGTGLYVRALTDGLSPTPPANPALRAELNCLPLAELVDRLRRSDPGAAAQIDCKNPRRVARAIEICEESGQPLATFRNQPRRNARGIFLLRSREDLHARIESNVSSMFAGNVIEEVAAVRERAGATACRAIGYREICAVLDGEVSERDAIELIAQATRQYAKRQLTWFRNQTTFRALELPANSPGSAELVLQHLESA